LRKTLKFRALKRVLLLNIYKLKKTQPPCFKATNNETVLNEAFAEIIKNQPEYFKTKEGVAPTI
jgi:hypothetical protein